MSEIDELNLEHDDVLVGATDIWRVSKRASGLSELVNERGSARSDFMHA